MFSRKSPEGKNISSGLDNRFDAGAEVLHNYQIQWAQMHRLTQDNAAKATVISQTIDSIKNILSVRDATVNEFELLASNLKFMDEGIKSLEEDVDSALGLMTSLEELLLEKQRFMADQQMKRQFDSQYLLKIYEEKRNRESERTIGLLKNQHLSRVQEMRRKEEMKLKERQEAFKAAFEQEVNKYKLDGVIEKPLGAAAEHASVSSLEDVIVEPDLADEETLQKFLTEDDE